MVAGRRLWGCNEQRAAQHQARRSGDLGIEAVVENRPGAGEARGLGAAVEPRRQVDQEDHGEAEQAEHEDDPPDAAPALVAQRGERKCGREQRHRNQQIGMCFAGGLSARRGRACRGQAGVAELADLNRAVVDELGGDQAGGRSDDRQADRSLRGQHDAGPRRRARRPSRGSQ